MFKQKLRMIIAFGFLSSKETQKPKKPNILQSIMIEFNILK